VTSTKPVENLWITWPACELRVSRNLCPAGPQVGAYMGSRNFFHHVENRQ
jgi:hypothetical protein